MSLAHIHALAKKVKLPKRLLNMRSIPPCALCLFRKTQRKLWRSKGQHRHIRGNDCKSGEECSMDQIFISSTRLSPQTCSNPTKRRCVGKQLTIDHHLDLYHVTHLEHFTTEEVTRTKQSCGRAESACMNTLKKIVQTIACLLIRNF